MASVPRIIAKSGRLPATTISRQAYRTLHAPYITSSVARNDGGRRQPTGQSIWRFSSTHHTRHATTVSESRDTITRRMRWPSRRGKPYFEDGRCFSTALARYNAARQDESQAGTSKTQSTQRSSTTTNDNTANISSSPTVAVPDLLKRMNPLPTHENIYTLPNALTTTRILTAPLISYALLTSHPILAFSLFAYSSATDLIDGYLARRYNTGTVLGSILDPFADKLLMILTTVSLYTIGTFPWWLALIILGRDAGLLLSALYFRWISLPPPRTMKRYWDFSLPSAEVRPTEISKINTLLQFLLVAGAVGVPVLPETLVEAWNLWGLLEGWMGLVAGTTVWSGLSYVFSRDAIRFIGRDNDGNEDKKGTKER